MLRNPLRLLIASALGFASWTATATADLLVNPSGGTTIAFSDLDDGSTSRSIGGTFRYFGTTITSINVGVNGNLSLSNFTGFRDAPLSSLSNIIAPFYDDLDLFQAATVSDQVVTGSYDAVTWNGVFNRAYLTTGATDTFQAILFTGNTVLDGFHFLAGDIAFSYGPMLQVFNTGTATVGLSNADGSVTAPLPGTTDGQILNTSLLPTGSQFLLLRTTAAGTATASLQSSAVPEPSSWLLLGAGLLLAARLRPNSPLWA